MHHITVFLLSSSTRIRQVDTSGETAAEQSTFKSSQRLLSRPENGSCSNAINNKLLFSVNTLALIWFGDCKNIFYLFRSRQSQCLSVSSTITRGKNVCAWVRESVLLWLLLFKTSGWVTAQFTSNTPLGGKSSDLRFSA